MELPFISSISVYPVKSMEPVLLPEVRVLRSGAPGGSRLRIFRLRRKIHQRKTQRENPSVAVEIRLLHRGVVLGRAETGLTAVFHADRQREDIEAWLAEFFGIPVSLRRNGEVGFPDDLDCPGPTVISTATLSEVASWFKPLDTAQLRLRIRANLEIGGVPPFLGGSSLRRQRIAGAFSDRRVPFRRKQPLSALRGPPAIRLRE